ncbi:MAG: hypothetical protein PHZ09_04875, partial [Eubacteriales bacterium]|nr:hypothetical protein [Eubacteriales bacterium]
DRLKEAQSQVQKQFEAGDIAEEQYRAFTREIEKTSAELGKLKSATEENNSALNKSGDDFSDAEKKASGFNSELKKSGSEAESSGGKLQKLGSILGGIGTAFAAGVGVIGAAAGAATTALSSMAVESAAYADNILTLSTQTGLSTDALQQFQYASELVDVSMETFTSSMSRNVKAMSEAAGGSKKYAEAYERLGVSVTNADGSLRSSNDVYMAVIDALGTVANETERDALAMELFGRSARDLNPLIQTGSEGLKSLAAEAEAAGAVFSSEQLANMGDFDDTIQKLTAGSDIAKTALGTILMPALNELGTAGVDLLGQFTSGINSANGDMSKIGDVISNTLSSAITMISEKLPELVEYGLQIVSSIAGAITQNLPLLLDSATEIITTLATTLIEALPQVLDTGIEILLSLIDGITSALPELIPVAVEAIMTIVEGLIDNLPEILEASLEIILALADGILKALPKLIESLPAIITGIVKFIISAIPQIIEAGIKLLISLVDALPEIIDGIVEAIPQIIDGIINAFLDNIPLIIDAGIKLFVALVENLPVIIAEIIKSIPEIISAIVEGFKSNLPKITEVGTNLIQGLWQGIKDAGAWLSEKISGFFSGIVNDIKDFFGIHSPSKLFEDEIGVNLALGIGEGFLSTMVNVSEDMKKSLPTGDLFTDTNITMPRRNVEIKPFKTPVNETSTYEMKFDKFFDITFTGDINQETLPKVNDMLKQASKHTIKQLEDMLHRKGVMPSVRRLSI